MKYNVKEHIEGECEFRYYRDSSLWYETSKGLIFKVPIEDVGTATFNQKEKGLLMMRYIRKQIAMLESEDK